MSKPATRKATSGKASNARIAYPSGWAKKRRNGRQSLSDAARRLRQVFGLGED